MDTTLVAQKFNQIGARVRFSEPTRFGRRLVFSESEGWKGGSPFSIDVRRDKEGEFFDIQVQKEVEMLVLDAQKQDKHLLLMVRDPGNPKAKFLCGHDERQWFTCAIPESAAVSSVSGAKEALKPRVLRQIESQEGVKTKHAQRRHRRLESGRKIHRQGEFMFIPEPGFNPPSGSLTVIYRNEPMSRGMGSKPHMAQYLYRIGGEQVYVSNYSSDSQNGLTQAEFDAIRLKEPKKVRRHRWTSMVKDPKTYVKGRITHKDHATLDLKDVWHRVYLNTEADSRATGRSVTFLD